MRPFLVTPRRPPRLAALARSALAVVGAAGALSTAGCWSRRAAVVTDGGDASVAASSVPLAESRITIRRVGGIAGLETEATVDGGKLTYAIVTRHICESSVACPPPTDAAAGPIDAGDARSLFARVEGEKVFDLKDDYGINPRLRDGVLHELTLRIGERTKTVRADDSTQPPELGRVEAAVMEAIGKARGRS
jgi:hypothetical protein